MNDTFNGGLTMDVCHDEDEIAYSGLVAKVAKVNAEAAEWLRAEAMELDSFEPDEDLGSCFMWSDTPQGHSYWFAIAKALDVAEMKP